jgi:hypothetical protein
MIAKQKRDWSRFSALKKGDVFWKRFGDDYALMKKGLANRATVIGGPVRIRGDSFDLRPTSIVKNVTKITKKKGGK